MKTLTFAVVALTLGACSKGQFHINGTISEAKDSTLYFENMSLDGAVVMDSVKLDETGSFSFSGCFPVRVQQRRVLIDFFDIVSG